MCSAGHCLWRNEVSYFSIYTANQTELSQHLTSHYNYANWLYSYMQLSLSNIRVHVCESSDASYASTKVATIQCKHCIPAHTHARNYSVQHTRHYREAKKGRKEIPPTHQKSTNTDTIHKTKKGGHWMPSLENWGDGLESFMASQLSPHTQCTNKKLQ